MPIAKIRACANCDTSTIVWQTDKPIKDCRGFALERDVKGRSSTTMVSTWVGFKGEKHKPGESNPLTIWPIQRYIWSDFLVEPGQTVRYRAIPMVGPAGRLEKAPPDEWSKWTDWVTISTGQTKGFEAYFNRGIVPAQWMAHQKPNKASLQKNIGKVGDKNRNFLGGALRTALVGLLAQAKKGRSRDFCESV
jgi:hypothetical protein